MERIKLAKSEKRLLRYIMKSGEGKPLGMTEYDYFYAAAGLKSKGLARVAYVEGGDIEDVTPTKLGRSYYSANPMLLNPIDWGLTVGVIAALAAIVSIFACTRLM